MPATILSCLYYPSLLALALAVLWSLFNEPTRVITSSRTMGYYPNGHLLIHLSSMVSLKGEIVHY